MPTVSPQAWPAFTALVADLRDAPTFEEGHRRFQALLVQYQGTFPAACRGLADDAEARLNHCKVPRRHRQYVWTSHLAERACEEERRRTKVMPHLWDEASVVKRVFAGLIRVSARWAKSNTVSLNRTTFAPCATQRCKAPREKGRVFSQ